MHPALAETVFQLRDLAGTSALAAALAAHLGPGFVLTLSGDLGAGKTALTRAMLRALGHTGRVRSPTFTLAEPYNLPNFELYHFDFYRFNSDEEWRDAGFDEILGGAAAAVIEWPELAGDSLPAPDLRLRLELPETPRARMFDNAAQPAGAPADSPDERRVATIAAYTEKGLACLSTLGEAAHAGRLDGVSCSGQPPAPHSR